VTSRGKKVLELAKEEARSLDHPLIGTEHLLLGMLVEGKGVAAQVLHESGVDLEKARSRVLTIRETIADDDHYDVPADEQPALVRVVLEYVNGAVLSKQFTTAREAAAFLEEQGRV
jgi:ATP-dependent Clp protease ATP-binding subunit ClpA